MSGFLPNEFRVSLHFIAKCSNCLLLSLSSRLYGISLSEKGLHSGLFKALSNFIFHCTENTVKHQFSSSRREYVKEAMLCLFARVAFKIILFKELV